VPRHNGTMTCLLGRSGPWEFRVITPRHGLLLCGSEWKHAGASGSQWKSWKMLGSGGRCREAGGRPVGDREGVGRGPGGAGEVQEVWKRSGRLWESAEEAGSNGTLQYLPLKEVFIMPHRFLPESGHSSGI